MVFSLSSLTWLSLSSNCPLSGNCKTALEVKQASGVLADDAIILKGQRANPACAKSEDRRYKKEIRPIINL